MGIRLLRLNNPTMNTGRTTGDSSMASDTVRMPKCSSHSHNSKSRYAVSDLPFPRGGKHVKIWRRSFVPLLLAWAGAHENPFGVNNELCDVVTDVWLRVFPGITLGDSDINILIKVVS
jgi:hypothetical protein